tara:strand:- start:523 stop:717 length:195 start_codon:yes stop_codon:yes gene_type:complete
MSDDETLEIITDEEDERYSSSEEEGEKCYYCDGILEYEENEFYDWESNRFYCEACWDNILHDDD